MLLPTSIQSVDAQKLKGKKVLVRCDFNVPVGDDGKVIDDLRIRKTLPTIAFLRESGARLILLSHIEGKKAKLTGGVDTLEPVAKYISEKYAEEFGVATGGAFDFIKDYISDEGQLKTAAHIEQMKDGDVVLFENVRVDAGEKKNDEAFAAKLAKYGELYVNDAFAVSHRAHASVVALPALFPDARYAGVQLMKEISHLNKVFKPARPFVFILGGAKFDTKLPLIDKFLNGANAADFVVLGGALLNDVLKAKGLNVGKSLVSNIEGGAAALAPVLNNPKLITPKDVTVQNATGEREIKRIMDIGDEDTIMDVGPSLAIKLKEILNTAKFVLWNGPLGNYEKGFKDQTLAVAREVVAASGVQVVIGGGDTTAAVAELGLDSGAENLRNANAGASADDAESSGSVCMPESNASSHMFVSTGGGAMLEYLLNETLPGIDALFK